jgi:death-on-curing protein
MAKRNHPIRVTNLPLVATLTPGDVQLIHEHVVREFANTADPVSPPGLRDIGLLESAVSRQHVGLDNTLKYESPCANAATLVYGICNDHPFHNGNKRTALLAGLLHLDRNGLVMMDDVGRIELYDLMTKIASHGVWDLLPLSEQKTTERSVDSEVRVIRNWLQSHTRRIYMGERSISYAQLYRIIERFGFEFGDKKSNHVEILRRRKTLFGRESLKHVTRCPCPGDARIVDIGQIKSIRKHLNLTEQDGVDSVAFYDTQTVIDTFIQRHRKTLRKLAKT